MQLDDLLTRYFGVTDLALASAEVIQSGIKRALVDLGLERDRGAKDLRGRPGAGNARPRDLQPHRPLLQSR